MRHVPKILGGSEKEPKARAKADRSIKKKGALEKYFNHRGDPQCDTILKMATA